MRRSSSPDCPGLNTLLVLSVPLLGPNALADVNGDVVHVIAAEIRRSHVDMGINPGVDDIVVVGGPAGSLTLALRDEVVWCEVRIVLYEISTRGEEHFRLGQESDT